jgi:hypothetical protein
MEYTQSLGPGTAVLICGAVPSTQYLVTTLGTHLRAGATPMISSARRPLLSRALLILSFFLLFVLDSHENSTYFSPLSFFVWIFIMKAILGILSLAFLAAGQAQNITSLPSCGVSFSIMLFAIILVVFCDYRFHNQ